MLTSHHSPLIMLTGKVQKTILHLLGVWFNKKLTKVGFFEFDGTLQDAQQQFPLGVALCKLGIAHSEGRTPRLVLDQTICGLNGRCHIPERSTLPSVKDVLRTFPIRNFSGDHMGFSLDIKAAHKRIVVREEEHGLLGFTLQGKLYFYKVAPFGATFSAAWWSRLGGWMLRLFHFLVWWSHVALLYVDDFLFFQSLFSMPLSATMICILSQLTNIPVSWQKCELAFSIQWIGWKYTCVQVISKSQRPRSKNSKIICDRWDGAPALRNEIGEIDWTCTLVNPTLAIHENLDSTLVP